MKKILILMVMILLVGCSNDTDNTLTIKKRAQEVELSLIDGSQALIDQTEDISMIYELIENINLEQGQDDYQFKRYALELFGKPSLKILDGRMLRLDDKTYVLQESIKQQLDMILKDILPIDTNEIVEVEVENEKPVEETTDLSGYTLLGVLNSGQEVYYLETDSYFKRPLVSEIILKTENETKQLNTNTSTIPVINPEGNRFAFVDGVGFEMIGQLYIYEDALLTEINSEEMTKKLEDSRTIKSVEWYENDSVFVILGYDSGTISQGGDIYALNLNTLDLRMIVDSKDGVEIVDALYEDGLLDYEVLTWLDVNYQQYRYTREIVLLEDYMSRLPIRVAFEPWNLEVTRMSQEDIFSLELFDQSLLESDLAGLEKTTDDAFSTYKEGNVEYVFSIYAPVVWRIDITGDTAYELPKDLAVGQSLETVLNKFPHEANYLKSGNGVFYGEMAEDYHSQSSMGSFVQTGSDYYINITTENLTPSMSIYFEAGVVSKIEVYMYIIN